MASFVWETERNVQLPKDKVADIKNAVELETSRHHLTKFYDSKIKVNLKRASTATENVLNKFTHGMAILFMAMTWIWNENNKADMDEVFIPENAGNYIHSYYKVIEVRSTGYILVANFINTHGLHRGDLRFIKIDENSKILNGEAKRLFSGDILKVYRLTPLKKMDLNKTVSTKQLNLSKPKNNVLWTVRLAELIERNLKHNQQFLFLNQQANSNCRLALMKTKPEIVSVNGPLVEGPEREKVFVGTALFPVTSSFFVENHIADFREINEETRKYILTPPQLIQIFGFEAKEDLTRIFKSGIRAFSSLSLHDSDRVYALEMNALFGNSVSTALKYGMRDSRIFEINGFCFESSTIKFTIPNPPQNPTFGKWVNNSIIVIQSSTLDSLIFGKVYDAQKYGEENLFVWVSLNQSDIGRCRRNCTSGRFFVSQDGEYNSNMELGEGFFHNMCDRSNGKNILKLLYGGRKINHRFYDVPPGNYVFPSSPKIRLDQNQSEYIDMLLRNPPLLIVDAPCGTGKTTAMATAMLEFCRRNNFGTGNVNQLVVLPNDSSIKAFKQFLSTIHETRCKYLLFDSQRSLETSNNYGQLLFECSQLAKQESNDCGVIPSTIRRFSAEVLITTARGLSTLLEWQAIAPRLVRLVQIDEAHVLSKSEFIWIMKEFQTSSFALIGDKVRIPHETRTESDQKLIRKIGWDNVFDFSTREQLFPVIKFYRMYRCHPRTDILLTQLIYKDYLHNSFSFPVDRVTRIEPLKELNSIWKNDFPIVIIHNSDSCEYNNSPVNNAELGVIDKLLRIILRKANGRDVGVLSFFREQAMQMKDWEKEYKDVSFGSFEEFYGLEKEIMIIGTTNSSMKRIGHGSIMCSAISRARCGVVIIGDVLKLIKIDNWKSTAKFVMKHGYILDQDLNVIEKPMTTGFFV